MVSDNVTKNLMGQRMHVDGPQISEMNLYNNSFHEIGTCLRQILTVWRGKFVSSMKTPQNGLFLCARIWVTWLWKALKAKPWHQVNFLTWGVTRYDLIYAIPIKKSRLSDPFFGLFLVISEVKSPDYDAVSDLMHNWGPQRPDFKSALRVVKMVLNT